MLFAPRECARGAMSYGTSPNYQWLWSEPDRRLHRPRWPSSLLKSSLLKSTSSKSRQSEHASPPLRWGCSEVSSHNQKQTNHRPGLQTSLCTCVTGGVRRRLFVTPSNAPNLLPACAELGGGSLFPSAYRIGTDCPCNRIPPQRTSSRCWITQSLVLPQ